MGARGCHVAWTTPFAETCTAHLRAAATPFFSNWAFANARVSCLFNAILPWLLHEGHPTPSCHCGCWSPIESHGTPRPACPQPRGSLPPAGVQWKHSFPLHGRSALTGPQGHARRGGQGLCDGLGCASPGVSNTRRPRSHRSQEMPSLCSEPCSREQTRRPRAR